MKCMKDIYIYLFGVNKENSGPENKSNSLSNLLYFEVELLFMVPCRCY